MTVTRLTPEQGLATFERCAATFEATVRAADLRAPVPACPGWTLADLVGHTGSIHLWAREAIRTGGPSEEPPAPATGVIDWYTEAAAALAETLRRTDPEAGCWGFGPKPRTARFWFRRQAHEVAVHLADAQAATGGTPAGAADHEALDGIDEVVTVFYPRQLRLGRIDRPVTGLALEAGGHTFEVEGRRPPAARVSGPAGAVHLLLWGRVPLDDARLTVEGDRAAAVAVLTAGIVP